MGTEKEPGDGDIAQRVRAARQGRKAPWLECAARGPGREKAWGHCDPLSQTPWGTLGSERPPLQHEVERHRELTRGKILKVTKLR